MRRIEALRILAGKLADELVVTSLAGVAREWAWIADRPRNFYLRHSMGLASSVGLGLALARPGERVIVLDGDGSVLMNLGSLCTIANCAPPNLALIIFDNQAYASTGLQPSATAGRADLAAICRGAGIGEVAAVGDPARFQAAVEAALACRGTAAVIARVAAEPVQGPKITISTWENKHRFLRAIGVDTGGD
ncbi:MAG: hypothetical protein HYY09_05565 [Firmicutes bacterium]|nr:hypothetical protein [Bacillota bacterium]